MQTLNFSFSPTLARQQALPYGSCLMDLHEYI